MEFLYNYDPDRVELFTDTLTVPSTGLVRLSHIPKEGSLNITGFTPTASDNPGPLEFFYLYSPDGEYWRATGILKVNASLAGTQLEVIYIPIGSRMDATLVSPLFSWIQTNKDKVVLKEQLSNHLSGLTIDWRLIINAPPMATTLVDGFMSKSHVRLLSMMVQDVYPLGEIRTGNGVFTPTQWAETLTVEDTVFITNSITGKVLKTDLTSKYRNFLNDNHIAASLGTVGVPSSTNKYVTANDPQYLAPVPGGHSHVQADITGLPEALASKAALVHTHTIGSINELQTTLDLKANTNHAHNIQNITGLDTRLTTLDTSISTLTSNLNIGLALKANIEHKHSPSDILGLEDITSGGGGTGDSGPLLLKEDALTPYNITSSTWGAQATDQEARFAARIEPFAGVLNGVHYKFPEATSARTIFPYDGYVNSNGINARPFQFQGGFSIGNQWPQNCRVTIKDAVQDNGMFGAKMVLSYDDIWSDMGTIVRFDLEVPIPKREDFFDAATGEYQRYIVVQALPYLEVYMMLDELDRSHAWNEDVANLYWDHTLSNQLDLVVFAGVLYDRREEGAFYPVWEAGIMYSSGMNNVKNINPGEPVNHPITGEICYPVCYVEYQVMDAMNPAYPQGAGIIAGQRGSSLYNLQLSKYVTGHTQPSTSDTTALATTAFVKMAINNASGSTARKKPSRDINMSAIVVAGEYWISGYDNVTIDGSLEGSDTPGMQVLEQPYVEGILVVKTQLMDSNYTSYMAQTNSLFIFQTFEFVHRSNTISPITIRRTGLYNASTQGWSWTKWTVLGSGFVPGGFVALK